MMMDELREEAERKRLSSYSDARVQREDWEVRSPYTQKPSIGLTSCCYCRMVLMPCVASRVQDKPIKSKLERWDGKQGEKLVLLEEKAEAVAKAKVKHD